MEREALETFTAFILQHFSRPNYKIDTLLERSKLFFLQKLEQESLKSKIENNFAKIVELCGSGFL